jgi:MFS family permease
LSWRWCLYVNLAFAIPTALAALSLLDNGLHTAKPRIDVPGTFTAVLGLFALVYGFNHAETASWGSPTTLGFIAAGIALLAGFAAIQCRAEHPLLPPRIVLDRDRGGSYLAVGIVGVGMFGAFFLLTFYLQQTLGYSPIHTGFAFLPLVGAVIVTATTSSAVLLQRTGPRPLMTVGMALAAAGMVLLTKLSVD